MTERLTHALDQGIIAPLTGPVLVIGATEPSQLGDLPHAGLVVEQGDFVDYQILAAAGFTPLPHVTAGAFQAALVIVSRNREQTMANLARAVGLTVPGGMILLDGAKTEGIEAMTKALRNAGLDVETHSKAHGKLAWFARPDPVPAVLQAWVAAGELSVNTAGLQAAPGMFSHGGIDVGSQLLADHLPALKGKVADFGAGWGGLAAQVLEKCPKISVLHLLESDHASLHAARLNVTDPRAQFHWGDATQPQEFRNLDAIVMNPPFHRSNAADPALGQAFISSAARHLAPGGQLLMVANRQLPYEMLLERLFAVVMPIAQTGVYKLISAERPRRRV